MVLVKKAAKTERNGHRGLRYEMKPNIIDAIKILRENGTCLNSKYCSRETIVCCWQKSACFLACCEQDFGFCINFLKYILIKLHKIS